MEQPRERRDRRQANWFWMNKSIVDEYGSQIGAIGIAVYAILARCANEDGHAFPSVRHIARHLGLSTNTVLKYLNKLAKIGLISITLRRDPAGDKDSTEYALLTPIIDETQRGVSINETPQETKPSSSTHKRGSRKEVSNDVRHGVSTDETPQYAEVSNDVRHGVSVSDTPGTGGVSQLVKGGVSRGETFESQENNKPQTQDLNTPPPTPQTGEGVSVRDTEAIDDMEAAFNPYTPGFNAFCAVYPAQALVGKRKAFRIWKAENLEPRAPELITKVEHLKQARWQGILPRFIPQLKTWFEDGSYDDELVPLDTTNNGTEDTTDWNALAQTAEERNHATQ